MYKGGKNHIKPADFLNFYTSEKGRRERWRRKKRGVVEIKGNIKVKEKYRNTPVKSKYFVLMVCVFADGGFKVGKFGCLGGKKPGQVSFLILHRASKIPSEFP